MFDDCFAGLDFCPERGDALLELCDCAVAGEDGEAGYFASWGVVVSAIFVFAARGKRKDGWLAIMGPGGRESTYPLMVPCSRRECLSRRVRSAVLVSELKLALRAVRREKT